MKIFEFSVPTRVFFDNRRDFTVGLGGGSAMDSAKAVALLAAQGGVTIDDYLAVGPHMDLAAPHLKPAFPVMCITTTAGAGSAVSIVDPEFMLSLPRDVTRNTGIDLLFHAVESFIANVATPFTDLFSREAMRLAGENLGRVLKDGVDLEARSMMAWANTFAMISIREGKSSTVGIHALGHSVVRQTDAPHGLTTAAVGPAYMRHTRDADTVRYAEVTGILGYGEKGMSDAGLGVKESMIEAMTDFAK